MKCCAVLDQHHNGFGDSDWAQYLHRSMVAYLLKDMSLMCGENIDENDERDIFRLLEGIKKFNSRA